MRQSIIYLIRDGSSRVELRLPVGAGPDDRGIGTPTPLETRDQLRAGRRSNFDGVVD